MKELYKRMLAVLLCLALTAAIAPATAFAGGTLPLDEPFDCAIDGIIVTLYEQYYSIDDEVYVDLAEILPEIEIESYNDLYLCVLTDAQRQTFSKDRPDYAANIGTTFLVILVDKTVEATEAAISALKKNHYVKWVEKNICFSPDDAYDVIPVVDPPIDDKPTVNDALEVLRVAAGLAVATPEEEAEFDKDGDGRVTVADALIVLRIAAGLA